MREVDRTTTVEAGEKDGTYEVKGDEKEGEKERVVEDEGAGRIKVHADKNEKVKV